MAGLLVYGWSIDSLWPCTYVYFREKNCDISSQLKADENNPVEEYKKLLKTARKNKCKRKKDGCTYVSLIINNQYFSCK